MTDPAALAAAAKLLYGDQWQSALARDLGVASRTVRRWKAGKSPLPPGVEAELRTRLADRFAEIGVYIGGEP